MASASGQVQQYRWAPIAQDEASSWRFSPTGSLIIPILSAHGQVLPFRPNLALDDAANWMATPIRSAMLAQLLTAVGKAPPFRPNLAIDDPPVWPATPIEFRLIVPILTAVGKASPFRPNLTIDDPPQWQGYPFRSYTLRMLNTSRPPQFRPNLNIDNPSYWMGQPIGYSYQVKPLIPSQHFLARAPSRRWIATAPLIYAGGNVAKTNDIGPAIDSVIEECTVTFDFGPWLASGVTIASVDELLCNVYQGTDVSASSRLLGAPQILASPMTSAPSAAVASLVGNMIGGVTYRIQCVVFTTDGQVLSLWTHLPCLTPN